jgi:uncharacterized membrane protein YoaK (UPF0700 family)
MSTSREAPSGGAPAREAQPQEGAPLRALLREAGEALWPAPGDRHGPLVPMMIALTFVTGVVDGASYLALGHVFVANMTGNVVFLGFALAGAHGLSASTSLVALASFLAGALTGGRLGAGSTGAHRGHVLRAAAAAQLLLLLVALVLALVVHEPPSSGARYALVVPMALAMGVQNAIAQQLAVPELTTTVLTKTLTGLVSEGGIAGGGLAKHARRGVSVLTMLLGALAGGLLVLHVAIAAALGLACGVVLVVGLAVHAFSTPDAAWR